MFKIDYKIITERFEKVEYISDEQIRYEFLLGNLFLCSSDVEIEVEWEWIPLLDCAYGLKMIVSDIKEHDVANEYFEFTENAETLQFSKQREQLNIVASFSSVVIETTFVDFEKAVYDFHLSISDYIRRSIFGEPSSVLQKYLY